jgi:large subunit ribosomal protein L10
MNRDQKSAVIDEIAASITDSQAIFAVDYRGITVEQAKELRTRLRESNATLRVVKNSLTERAADKAGAEQLKTLLAGPTALPSSAATAPPPPSRLPTSSRTTQLLAFKGGLMDGAVLSPAEITSISRLPSRDVLYGQLVGLVANPITSARPDAERADRRHRRAARWRARSAGGCRRDGHGAGAGGDSCCF